VVDIFDEVSEDLRNDRAVALAKQYGSYLILAMLAVLAGVGGQQYWQYHQTQQANAAATQYLALTQTVDAASTAGTAIDAPTATAAAQSLATFALTAPEGYKTLANLRAAGLYSAAGQLTQAESLWDSTAADTRADPLLRDLASLLWAQHALGSAADADVLARLAPLTESTNPYRGLAVEAQALTYIHAGQPARAKSLLSEIAVDGQVPEGVRNRAQLLLIKLNG